MTTVFRRSVGAVALAVLAAGCPGPADQVSFELDAGAVLGGAESTVVVVDSDLGVVRTELYLDNQRVGAAEFAPFRIEWSTLAFAEGPHHLRARAYLDDGDTLDGAIDVVIDHTPPRIAGVPAEVEAGAEVEIDVSDSNGVERIAVEIDGHVTEATATGGGAARRFTVTWPAACGAGVAHITAVDRAGWTTEVEQAVATRDPGDRDCDRHRAIAAGGDDCDDGNSSVYPGAADPGGAIDRNCDGVPGVDDDGDGVASLATGGGDCDDEDDAVHPARYRWASRALVLAGQPVRWEPGTAAVAVADVDGARTVAIAINRGGSIELVTAGAAGEPARQALVSGANPGAVALARAGGEWVLVYGRARELRVHAGDGSRWRDELIATLDTTVNEPAVDVAAGDDTGGAAARVHVAARSGIAIWYALRDAGAWQAQRVAASAALAARAPGVVARGRGARVAYVLGTALYEAEIAQGAAAAGRIIGDASHADGVAGLAGLAGSDGGWIYGQGGALVRARDGETSSVSPQWRRIERVAGHGPVVFQARSEAGAAVVGFYLPAESRVEVLPGAELEAASADGPAGVPAFAAPGSAWWIESASLPDERIGDGEDTDCDGTDR